MVIKAALRRDVEECIPAGWGILATKGPSRGPLHSAEREEEKGDSGDDIDAATDDAHEEPPVPVIKIRSTRGTSLASSVSTPEPAPVVLSPLKRTRSHSRIRRAQQHDHVSDEEFDVARTRQDIHEHISNFEGSVLETASMRKRISIASRFSSYTHGGISGGPEMVQDIIPFALLNPSPPSFSHNSETPILSRLSTFSLSGGSLPLNERPKEDFLDEMFTRRYRWGTVDVLNPDHCDFVPMRAVIFGWGLKVRRFVLLLPDLFIDKNV